MAHSRSVVSRLIRAYPLLDSPSALRRPLSDEAKKRVSVLSRSTLFLQDGISINELPILIRRLDKSFIPVVTNKLSLDDIQKISQQDEIFKMKLQDCSSAKNVFKLLEIPSDQVTPYTAAFALDRLCQLQNARNNDMESIHSFIRDAVLKELCDTIARGVRTLTSEILISLVRCSSTNDEFPLSTRQALVLEVETRLSESRFSVSQLCELVHHIHADESLNDLLDNVHVHLGHRTEDMESKNLIKVYEALEKKRTVSTKSTLSSIEPVMMKNWWQLTDQETASLLTSLVHLNYKSVQILTVIGKLLFINIQNFDRSQLKKVIYAYIHFDFSNSYLFKALEKYAVAKNDKMDNSVTALIMEYCRSCRHLSIPIFDATASHLRKHGHTYSANELYLILRPFGQLNYLPKKAGPIFGKVEAHLTLKLDEFRPEKMVELLTSFAYIERFPINFVRKVFTPYTFSIVNNIVQPLIRQEACRNLLKLQSAVKIEWQDCRVPYMFSYDPSKDKWLDQHRYRLLCEMRVILKSMLPGHSIRQSEYLYKSPYVLDFLIEKKDDALVSLLPHALVAVVVSSSYDFTINTHTPLGDYAMKLRHIRIKKMGLVEIRQSEYSRSGDKELYLKTRLAQYINSCKST